MTGAALRIAADPAGVDSYEPGITVAEAARIIGCHPSRVRRLIGRGLRGYKDGRSVRVYPSSVTAYREQNEIGGAAAEPERPLRPTRRQRDAEANEMMAALGKLGLLRGHS